jgi:hypothetical protein
LRVLKEEIAVEALRVASEWSSAQAELVDQVLADGGD